MPSDKKPGKDSSRRRRQTASPDEGQTAEDATSSSKAPPPPSSPWSRAIFRVVLVCIVVYLFQSNKKGNERNTVIKANDLRPVRRMNVTCSTKYENFPGCTPTACGRVVFDGIVSEEEIKALLGIAKKGMSLGGSSGGATILDLHSGALSMGDKFVNIFKYAKEKMGKAPFTAEDFAVYSRVKNRVKRAVEEQFDVKPGKIHLTHPTFFSRITADKAVTEHDEYWHPHIDRVTYGTFFYTSLLYLSTKGFDFDGGSFQFMDPHSNHTVEPHTGRLSAFTSGEENVHRVEPVTRGTRYAITISFTCDKQHAIKDPAAR